MKCRCLPGLAIIVTLFVLLPIGAQAAVVGHFTQVEGRVDLLKGGNLPANPVKVEDGVEPGDVIRTKSLSRAQLKFVDDTILNIAPESRVGIEEYMYDASKGQRQAVLQVFRGLVQTLVGKVIKTEKPDFIMKTHTAILGVRGTEWYTSLGPQFTDVYVVGSIIAARNLYQEITGEVLIRKMEFSRIGLGLAPTVPTIIVPEDLQILQQRMKTGGGSARGGPSGGQPLGGDGAFNTTGIGKIQQTLMSSLTSGLYIAPNPVPVGGSLLSSYNFSQTFAGTITLSSIYPYTSGIFYNSSFSGSGTRTGVYAGAFTSAYAINATSASMMFGMTGSGSFSATSSGTVTGRLGGVMTGTMNMTASSTISGYNYTFNFSGPVTIGPAGNLAFRTTGTVTVPGSSGTTSGTLAQQKP